MTWIDDCIAEEKQREEKQLLIADARDATYERLWTEITAALDEARRKGRPSQTNGSPRNREVRQGQARLITIALRDDGIAVAGDVNLFLRFDTGSDNVVFLAHEGSQISLAEAARAILQPFLFPR